MLCLLTLLPALFTILCTLTLADDCINDADFPNNAITRDVCIIGGGSGGTYPAIRLQQMGKSVVVVEKEAVLGGHTNTYIDPVTGAPVDYGVAVWEDIPVVQNYFAYLGVALITVNTSAPSPFVNDFADFASGTIIRSLEMGMSSL
jgi:predicted NAD/FAD-binding protein